MIGHKTHKLKKKTNVIYYFNSRWLVPIGIIGSSPFVYMLNGDEKYQIRGTNDNTTVTFKQYCITATSN